VSVADVVVGVIGGTTAGTAIVVFLSRSLLQSLLTRDLERFKAELKAQHDVELERLRADLRVAASERETRFSRLHERRLDVIAGLYALAVATWRTNLKMLSAPGGYDPEALDCAWNALGDLHHEIEKQRIWVPAEVREALTEVVVTMSRAYHRARRAEPGGESSDDPEKSMDEAGDLVDSALELLRTRVDARVHALLDGAGSAPAATEDLSRSASLPA
jgi:hypothetical protein